MRKEIICASDYAPTAAAASARVAIAPAGVVASLRISLSRYWDFGEASSAPGTQAGQAATSSCDLIHPIHLLSCSKSAGERSNNSDRQLAARATG